MNFSNTFNEIYIIGVVYGVQSSLVLRAINGLWSWLNSVAFNQELLQYQNTGKNRDGTDDFYAGLKTRIPSLWLV